MRAQEAVIPFAAEPAMQVRDVPLDQIKLDQRAQPRDHLNKEVVARYAEEMASGAQFPPLVVFFDGQTYWLADGFHRHYAAIGNQAKTFSCEVRVGGVREAILFSCGANATHGYARTNADKRHAVMRLLEDPEWRGWSDREIARRCAVNNHLVGQIRSEFTPRVHTGSSPSMERTFIHPKTGAPSRMNTANIGGRVPERTFPRDLTEVYREPTPAEALLQSPAYQEDQSNTFIWSSIRAIDEEMARLNISPEEAARRFPVTLKHVYSREKAERIADWFQRFADAWRF